MCARSIYIALLLLSLSGSLYVIFLLKRWRLFDPQPRRGELDGPLRDYRFLLHFEQVQRGAVHGDPLEEGLRLAAKVVVFIRLLLICGA